MLLLRRLVKLDGIVVGIEHLDLSSTGTCLDLIPESGAVGAQTIDHGGEVANPEDHAIRSAGMLLLVAGKRA